MKTFQFNPLPASYNVDPIIFQFGRKRKGASEDTADEHRKLFCFKQQRLESELDVNKFLGADESQRESKRFRNPRGAVKRRAPFNNLHQKTNQELSLQFSNLVNQIMIAALRAQVSTYQAPWIPPKEEPLDLSCKGSKMKFPGDSIFRSIRKLIEPQYVSDFELQKFCPFQFGSKILEYANFSPQNIDVKSNFPGILNQKIFNYNNSVSKISVYKS